MSELIGRLFSFEEHLGRGLVKLTFYLAVILLVVTHGWLILQALWNWPPKLTDAFVTVFQFFLWVAALRVAAEFFLAVISIDENLQNGAKPDEGFEAGITPTPYVSKTDTPQPAARPSDLTVDTIPPADPS